MKLFRVTLEAKGYLHFYASEYLKVTRVSEVLHNWALMFAVNDIRANPELHHLENLRRANFYCTPAIPLAMERRIYKRNPVPEDTGAGKMGLMEIEYYLPGSTFELHILSRDETDPPDLIHYGKKRVPCRLLPATQRSDWRASSVPFRPHTAAVVRPAHLINPLDYDSIEEVSYAKKFPMKPSPLYYLCGKFASVLIAHRINIVVPNIDESPQWN